MLQGNGTRFLTNDDIYTVTNYVLSRGFDVLSSHLRDAQALTCLFMGLT